VSPPPAAATPESAAAVDPGTADRLARLAARRAESAARR
jgi:hypothetical protein